MHLIEVVARRSKQMLGLADDSRFVSAIRPAYNALLERLYGSDGLLRLIDGQEHLRLRPRDRLIPEDYEPSVFSFLKRHIGHGDVIVEVGAHVGVFTMIMARWVGATGHVHAFEPNPICREALVDHLCLNDLRDRVTVSPSALSDKEGTASFYAVGTSGTSSLSDLCIREDAEHVTVPVTTIDHYCLSNDIRPHLIKIDVEGFEFSVLKGARETLTKSRPTILVEFHPMNWSRLGIDPGRAYAQLADLDYTLSPLDKQINVFEEYGHVALEPRSKVLA